ncbi:protein of unknown function [Shewanella benthica]|uniref:Uncharacterized protein n=1 Tax=Shewanella benthica TaxID=43661 RepID=A0A330M634_9GAMM|nr:protein of unknown function [Shewanella benthica]
MLRLGCYKSFNDNGGGFYAKKRKLTSPNH